MQIIGFNFKKISVERKKTPDKEINVKTALNVTSIDKEDVEAFKGKEVFSFSFEFKITYDPGFADVIFEGAILAVLDDAKLAKTTLKDWKKKKLPQEVRIPIFNTILSKCSLKALQLEEDIGLPIHLPLPRLRPAQEGSNTGNVSYTG